MHNQHGDRGILSSRPGAVHGEASWACKPHGRLPEPTLPPALGPCSLRPARGYHEGGCPAGHTLYPAGDGPLTGRAPHPGGGLQSRATDRHTSLPPRPAEATSHHARWKGDRGRGFPGPLHAPPSAANIPCQDTCPSDNFLSCPGSWRGRITSPGPLEKTEAHVVTEAGSHAKSSLKRDSLPRSEGS